MDNLINILAPVIYFSVLFFLLVFSFRFLSVLEKINDSLNSLVFVLYDDDIKKKKLLNR